MWILFIPVVILEVALYFFSKNKYDDYLAPLDKKIYPLKDFYPIGLYVLDAVKYKHATKYDRDLFMKVAEISGHKYAPYYLKIHWATKITYILLALLFLGLVGISMEPDAAYGVFSIILLGLMFFIADYELNEKIKKRRLTIQIEFPEFLNKLTLLINAGMAVNRAWEKVATDHKQESPLYNELAIVLGDIRAGKSETQAYEDFAKRCRIPEVTKFVSVIVQNLRKGGSEVVSILRLQANDCWAMRKNAAKRLGEEAATKMLLPMMIMFLAILLIVITPAILGMQGL